MVRREICCKIFMLIQNLGFFKAKSGLFTLKMLSHTLPLLSDNFDHHCLPKAKSFSSPKGGLDFGQKELEAESHPNLQACFSQVASSQCCGPCILAATSWASPHLPGGRCLLTGQHFHSTIHSDVSTWTDIRLKWAWQRWQACLKAESLHPKVQQASGFIPAGCEILAGGSLL